MVTTTPPSTEKLEGDLKQIENNMQTLRRVLTTKYPIAQTPKEVIWTLNKAKLYRYVPVVPRRNGSPSRCFWFSR